ncbi:hypothetical protein PFISCL1PPCAC_7725, partial [Pristionchus fissidentatus]
KMAGKQREAKEKASFRRKAPKLADDTKRAGKRAKCNTGTSIFDNLPSILPRPEEVIDARFNEQLDWTLVKLEETMTASRLVIKSRERYLNRLRAGEVPYGNTADPISYHQQVEESKLIEKRGRCKERYDTAYHELEQMNERGEVPEILDEDQDTKFEILQARMREEFELQDIYWEQEREIYEVANGDIFMGSLRQFKRTRSEVLSGTPATNGIIVGEEKYV